MNGNHRQIAPGDELDIKTFRLLLHPGQILVGRAGIDYEAELRGFEEVDDQVVQYPPGFIQQAGIEGFARPGQLGDVIGQQAAQPARGIGAGQVDRQHVGNIEHAGVRAYRLMFFDLRAVMNRHVPAGKIDHFRAVQGMLGVERCHPGTWGCQGMRHHFFRGEGCVKNKEMKNKKANESCLIRPICPWYLRDCTWRVDETRCAVVCAPSVGEPSSPLSRFFLRRRFVCLSGYGIAPSAVNWVHSLPAMERDYIPGRGLEKSTPEFQSGRRFRLNQRVRRSRQPFFL